MASPAKFQYMSLGKRKFFKNIKIIELGGSRFFSKTEEGGGG